MRVFIIVATLTTIVDGFIATSKATPDISFVQVLDSYKKDPQVTAQRLEDAMLKCVPTMAASPTGSKFARTVVVPLYVKILSLRADEPGGKTFTVQLQKWIITNQPEILTNSSDDEFSQLIDYLQAIGENDVESCILSSAMSVIQDIEIGADEWKLRL